MGHNFITDVKVTTPEMGLTTLAITYFHRTAENVILGTLPEIIVQELRKVVLEDAELRGKLHEAVQAAAVGLPLDAITEAVKKAVASEK